MKVPLGETQQRPVQAWRSESARGHLRGTVGLWPRAPSATRVCEAQTVHSPALKRLRPLSKLLLSLAKLRRQNARESGATTHRGLTGHPRRQPRWPLLGVRLQDPDPKETPATPLLCWVLPACLT